MAIASEAMSSRIQGSKAVSGESVRALWLISPTPENPIYCPAKLVQGPRSKARIGANGT